MIFYLNDERFKYELEKLSRLFLPFEKFDFTADVNDLNSADSFIKIIYGDLVQAELKLDGKSVEKSLPLPETYDFLTQEVTVARVLYNCFVKLSGYTLPWGMLTGIRPAKLMGRLIADYGKDNAVDYFKNTLLVSDKKTKLCLECYHSERKIVAKSNPDSFSLYVSVPFCPSRCNYCSFVSHSVEQAQKLIPQYVEMLCREIKQTAEIANDIGLKLQTVYIGGGTPTTLSAEQLTGVMSTINSSFYMSNVMEYTVEAGRPDTVTRDKLLAIKQGGATRISINPQTMNDDVLKNIGRRHTVAEMIDAFKMAREVGFQNINTDLIAGLSGDTYESFCRSVDELIKLDPENVTVHTLSMKRASNLTKSRTVFEAEQGKLSDAMVDYAYNRLSESKIFPYYMYRQSKTAGNLENVGYAKKGYEGLYNVYIMDETHTILACGASAVTKLRQPNGPYIERIFNYKYPYEYIERFDTLAERKKGITEFYARYNGFKV